MLRIVVFDGGWGGELVANFLASELKTVNVTKVIDWSNAPYEGKGLSQIYQLTEQCLAPYIGDVDLIVLGGYVVSAAALDYLRRQYPKQQFIGMGINYYRITKTRCIPENITLLGNVNLLNDSVYEEVRQKMSTSTIICPDCSGWDELIDSGEMSEEILRTELQEIFLLSPNKKCRRRLTPDTTQPFLRLPNLAPTPLQLQIANFLSHSATPSCKQEDSTSNPFSYGVTHDSVTETSKTEVADDELSRNDDHSKWSQDLELLHTDVVLLLNTHFWDIKTELENVFGYRTRIMDFRQKLLHDVCFTLGLRGVDGAPSK